MRFDQRIKKIEDRVNPGGGFVVFVAGGPEKERAASFERQEADYLKKGGDPGALRIKVIDRFS
jgi:hypothetical protein